MNLNLSIGPLVSLLAGILILAIPRLLNYIVAAYLIVMGLLGLFGASGMHLRSLLWREARPLELCNATAH